MIFFILFCISLVVNDAEHLLMCLFTLCISSSMKCLFMSFAHFLEGLFLLLIFKNSLYILDTNLLSDTKFAYITHIFFQSVNCLISLMGSFSGDGNVLHLNCCVVCTGISTHLPKFTEV